MFPLHTDTPLKGRSLEELFHTDSARIAAMIAQLAEHAKALGLPFGKRHMTYNSRLAQELGIWAEERGLGHAYHMAAFTAYFARGENIAERAVLLDIVSQAGLSLKEAEQVLDRRSHSAKVDHDWERSRAFGITAAPTFVMGDKRLVGAQSYARLKGFILESSGGRVI